MLKLIGRYQVKELIGEGAMADVYRAYDPGIDRVLAIKVLKGEVRRNPEYVARFLREARAAGVLSHTSIVTIYDVGETEGYPYIAMELLDGEPLDAVLKRAPRLPAADVIAIGIQLAEALAYAHGAGVVHRDIKPSNIVLSPDGKLVKILDFGIARMIEHNEDDDSLKTQVGQVMGTPRYMSPEQVLGQPIDGSSDLFSVGAVLYELLSGRRAFDGATAAALALQIVQQEPPPLKTIVADAPAGLQFIIAKLLCKRPDRRYADGAELAQALRREQAGLEAADADVQARRHLPLRVRLTLATGAVTALVMGVSIWGVLGAQYRAMEHMALNSGAAITTFVASNAALSAAENAGLPPAEQDWAPVAAFVQSAASDANVRAMTVVDASGIVRAATNPALIGQPYRLQSGAAVLQKIGQVTALDRSAGSGRQAGDAGFQFTRPILYAGHRFGMVDVTLNKSEFLAAANLSRWLMAGLAMVVLATVAAISYTGAQLLARPMLRLKQALIDAGASGDRLRISHNRRDEFGELFDAFNRFNASVQARLQIADPALENTSPDIIAAAFSDQAGAAEAPAVFAAEATRVATAVDQALERTQMMEPAVFAAVRKKA